MDIVAALRNDEKSIVLNGHICLVNHEAANEIETLRKQSLMLANDRDVLIEEVQRKNAEIERLREALRKIENYAYQLHVASSKKEYVIIQEMVVAALKEGK